MAVINGTESDDSIDEVANGGSLTGSDIINAGGGNDLITMHQNTPPSGQSIEDIVHGGAGTDTLAMTLYTPSGFLITADGAGGYSGSYIENDNYRITFDGIEAFALTLATAGSVTTGAGADSVVSTASGASTITTGAGNDTITAGIADTVDGGADTDTLISTAFQTSPYAVHLTLSGGYGSYMGTIAGDNIGTVNYSNIENFQVTGGNAADDFAVGDGNDILSGGAGNDVFVVGKGINTISGGADTDALSIDFSQQTTGVAVDLTKTGQEQTGGSGSITGVESFKGTVTGTAFGDSFVEGNYNFDATFNTGDGNDTVSVVLGNDTANLGAGTDTLVVDRSGTPYSVHVDNFSGSLAAGYSGSIVNDNVDTVAFTGVENFTLTTGSGADTILFGDGTNIVTTNDGADTITLGTGPNTVNAGDGNDTVQVGSGVNTLDGGAAQDALGIDLSAKTAGVTIDLTRTGAQQTGGTGTVAGFESFAGTITGSAYADTFNEGNYAYTASFSGGAGDDFIHATGGDNTVDGGTGSDTLVVDRSATPYSVHMDAAPTGTLSSGYSGTIAADYAGTINFSTVENFTILSGTAGDTIALGDGTNTVSTGDGADTVVVGKGVDTVDGGTGTDTLTIDLSAKASGVTVDLTKTGAQQTGGGSGSVTNFETFSGTIAGTAYADSFVEGNYAANADFETGGGNDRVSVMGGDDTVNMGAGTDTLVFDRNYTPYSVNLSNLSGSLANGYSGAINADYEGSATFTGVENFIVTTGTAADGIRLGDGANTVTTNDGADAVTVGNGANTVNAGDGSDTVQAGSGVDTLDGGAGQDALGIDLSAKTVGVSIDLTKTGAQQTGGTGSVTGFESFAGTITGTAFADTFNEGNYAYTASFSTGGGDDFIHATGGDNTVDGGAGSDTLVVDRSAIPYSVHMDAAPTGTLASGYSGTIAADYSGNTTFSNVENFTILSGTAADVIRLGDGIDTVSSGDGADTVVVGKGVDVVDGGIGTDTLSIDFSAKASGVTVDLTKTGAQQTGGGSGSVTNFESFAGTVTGTGFADTFIDGISADTTDFETGAGDDRVAAANGSNTVNMGAGTDTLVFDQSATNNVVHMDGFTGSLANGYSGTLTADYVGSAMFTGVENFVVTTGAAGDTITLGDGANTVSTGAGNDAVLVGKGVSILDGGADTDTLGIDFSAKTSGVTIDLTKTGAQQSGGTGSITNFEGFAGTVTGSGYADTFIEGSSTATADLETGAGDDRVAFTAGSKTVNMGAGTDTLVFNEGATNNVVHMDNFAGSLANGYSGTLTADYVGSATFTGVENFVVTAGAASDTITLGDGANTVAAGAGNDIVVVGKGVDILDGGADTDTLGIDFSGKTSGVTVDLTKTGAQQSGGTGSITNFESFAGTVTGTAFADSFVEGNYTYNADFETGAGNDRVAVSGGNDIVNMGAGTDTLVFNESTTNNVVHVDNFAGSLAAGYSGTLTADYVGSATFTGVENFVVTTGAAGDTITLGDGADVVRSGDGNDIVSTAGGADFVAGGAGDDTLDGGDGIDTLSYDDATAAVTVSLAVTTQQATGGGGNDTIANFENLTGSAFADTLTGNAGANTIDGGAGIDAMSGGAGNDTYLVDNAGDTVTEATNGGSDTVLASVTYTLATGQSIETLATTDPAATTAINLTGNEIANTIRGNAGANTIAGAGGNDTIDGGAGNDALDGGMGIDTASYASAGAGVTVSLAVTSAQATGGAGSDTLTGFENVTGSGFADTLAGTSGDNVIDGGAGTDTVSYAAAGGGVTIDLSRTTAQATGGAGTDTLLNIENVTGSAFADTLAGNAGTNVLDGGAGTDTLTYANAAAGVTVDLSATSAQVTGGAGTDTIANIENIVGSGFNDALMGTTGANTIDGGAGSDTLTGGTGDDIYYVDNSGDQVIEAAGAGNDTVYTSVGYTLGLGQSIETLATTDATGTGSINLSGNDLANAIQGNAGANTLDGGGGTDVLTGFGGDDTYIVDNAGDQVIEAPSGGADTVLTTVSYTLAAGQSIETLATTNAAGTAPLSLTGNDLTNAITGNAGANTIDGGAGADTMTGLGGDDIYRVDNAGDVVTEAANGGNDIVLATVSYTLAAGQAVETLATSNAAGTGAIALTGNDLANTLQGNAGANTLDGGGGADVMAGYGGDDTYIVDNSGDQVNEATNAGNDIVMALVSYALAAAQSVETLTTTNAAGTAAINLTGNELANAIRGNAGTNTLNGGGGADVLTGLGGDDTYVVDNAADQVIEAANGGTDRVVTSVNYTLAAGQSIEALSTGSATGTGAITLTGNDIANTITGNDGANIIDGGAGADQLVGRGGDDVYFVDNAGDTVTEAANGGNDTVDASVSYSLATGQAIETLTTTNAAGTAAINLTGNDLANAIIGNAGANTLDGGGGADVLTGGAGNDTYIVDNAGDQVIEAANGGTDAVLASVSYTLAAGQSVETLATTNVAGTAAINLTGNDLVNAIQGNAGANALNGGGGADVMTGFGGNDVYSVDNAGDQVIEASGGGNDTVLTTISYTLATGQDIERLQAAASGATTALILTGNVGVNTIQGNAGANTLDGGAGADVMIGLGGNDTYSVDNAGDQVTEAANGGNDTVNAAVSYALGAGQSVEILAASDAAATTAIDLTGNEFANILRGNAGANTLDGGTGADQLTGYGGDDTYLVDNTGDRVSEVANGGNDRVLASANYTLYAGQEIETLAAANAQSTTGLTLGGNEFANALFGDAGNDVLNGGKGIDTLTGYAGDDTYYVDNAADVVNEAAGGGTDRVAASVSYTLGAGQEIERLTTAAAAGVGALALTGNEFAQRLDGNAGNNVLDGKGGADQMYGGTGDDYYYVDNAADRVFEAANAGTNDRVFASVSYTLSAGQEIERLLTTNAAGTDALTLKGNEFGQIVQGNAGANIVDGGLGADTLYGFGGADIFLFDTALGSGNIDAIADFAVSTNAVHDTIKLARSVFTQLAAGSTLSAGAFKDITNGAVLDGDDRILYNRTTGALSYDSDGSGNTAAVQFATISTNATLSAADFAIG